MNEPLWCGLSWTGYSIVVEISLGINTDLAREILVGFIKSEITRVGLSRAVIGLSGGIDSALSCVLAVEALGAENVLAVRMPYRSSSKDSLDHAQLLIDHLGVQHVTIEITEMVEPLFKIDLKMSDMRKGNIMARARMIVLYDQSEVFKGLVVGTSNKSEILLGYSTLFGDSACSVNPLGDVWKTHVFRLAEQLGLPAFLLHKPPSADLWAGQTDAGELGFDYAEADPVLYWHHEQGLDRAALVAAGFAPALVDRVLLAYRRSRFKWRPTVVARTSASCVNVDRILPRNPER